MKKERTARALLREILNLRSHDDTDLIKRINADPALSEDLKYLEAKDLVKVTRAWGGEIVMIRPLDAAFSFFPDRAAAIRQRWLDRAVGFASGIATAAIAQLIIQALQNATG